MINAADLRLGNIVLDLERGEVATVIGIEADRVQLKPSPYIWTKCENIEGIKISDEWLKSYGFDNRNIGYKQYRNGNCYILEKSKNGYWCGNIMGTIRYFHFLHELQNSYKEVEGTELKIKT